jgi:type II secretory pathway pseudopilin PulG
MKHNGTENHGSRPGRSGMRLRKGNRFISAKRAAHTGDGAFTLLELLVVIATLAILALLLAPALARTDDNGTRMVCLQNLRQMGMAENMYAGDNRDYFPQPNFDGGASGSPQGWLYTVTNGAIPDPVDGGPWTINPVSAWRTGAWFQYVQNQKYYLCPVDIESKTYTTAYASGGRANKLSSYVMNGAVNGFPGTGYPLPCKITSVWSPACYLLWEPDENADGPGNPGALEFNDGGNFPDTSEGIGRLHSANSGNMLCVGGNVQFVTIQTYKTQTVVGSGQGPGGKTLAWWYPGPGN